MRLEEFDYDLPEELIAQEPLPERDASRLLVLDRAGGGLRHDLFRNLPGYLREGDLLVLNDTRVVAARLETTKEGTGARVSVLLLRRLPDGTWEALCDRASRAKVGTRLLVDGGALTLLVEGAPSPEIRRLRLVSDLDEREALERWGLPPLPPYIRREGGPRPYDRERYQTVYARREGAVAAPTAGLHFTEAMLERIERGGVELAWVTLHVGRGTFEPVRAGTVEEHVMEPERCEVPARTVEAVERTRRRGGRVVAVGTTVVRALESAAAGGGLAPLEGEAALFIYPGYEFKVVDALLTNFHLPRSTLLLLVSAFAGRERILAAYREAVARRYRFYSYGDAMLIL